MPAALMAAQAGLLIFLGEPAGSWANDQTTYHLEAIQKFATELPTPDIVDYKSATSPGWHLMLALLVKAGATTTTLRMVSAAVGVLLTLVATHTAARWTSPRTAALLTLPLALTPYAVGGSAWITTDVPALACVALSMAALLKGFGTTGLAPFGRSSGHDRWSPWGTACWAMVGVAIRQPVVWLAALIMWRGVRERRPSAIFAAMLPVAVLGVLVMMWGGLIPPAYRALHQRGANPAGLVVFLALIGAWGAP
ncbi:MAG: hypothetical protein JNK53_05470, partial [Phycisphaerae bacterium]|nr:hypothetical protein [Phycisphaerae bacterium]